MKRPEDERAALLRAEAADPDDPIAAERRRQLERRARQHTLPEPGFYVANGAFVRLLRASEKGVSLRASTLRYDHDRNDGLHYPESKVILMAHEELGGRLIPVPPEKRRLGETIVLEHIMNATNGRRIPFPEAMENQDFWERLEAEARRILSKRQTPLYPRWKPYPVSGPPKEWGPRNQAELLEWTRHPRHRPWHRPLDEI